MTRNRFSVLVCEDEGYTSASIQITTTQHNVDGIVGGSSLYLSRAETEELIEALKDKLGTLRWMKSA